MSTNWAIAWQHSGNPNKIIERDTFFLWKNSFTFPLDNITASVAKIGVCQFFFPHFTSFRHIFSTRFFHVASPNELSTHPKASKSILHTLQRKALVG